MASKLLKITREEYKELLPVMVKIRERFVKATGCDYCKVFTHRNCDGGRTKLWLHRGKQTCKLPATVTVGKYVYSVEKYTMGGMYGHDIALMFKRIK